MPPSDMDGKGSLALKLVDVYGEPINDQVDVSLAHTVLSDRRRITRQDAKALLSFPTLDYTQGGIYRLLVYPTRYRPVSQFVRISEGKPTEKTLVFPIDPARVSRAEFPSFEKLPADLQKLLNLSDVEDYPGASGSALYQQIDDLRKAGLLNLYCKMCHTRFPNGRHVFSYVSSLYRLRADRFFAHVDTALRDETINSTHDHLFHEVLEAMHTPPPSYCAAKSYKTLDHYGNLQLSFFSNPSTLDLVVDADIDDAQGIEHVFQVMSHVLSGNETHPYDIHEILIGAQQFDPGYRLIA